MSAEIQALSILNQVKNATTLAQVNAIISNEFFDIPDGKSLLLFSGDIC
jgi:hypothetical protein